ncbi:MAG TPA: extracellular solute-binding protein [Acetobacteraceae bacterium]
MLRRDVLTAAAAALLPNAAFAQREAAGTVNVLYAGSLVNLMEHGVGPAFAKADRGRFQGYAGGSNKVASEIKGKLRRGDVFVSASPNVNDMLIGVANGDWVSWYITFAQSPLVIGYNPSSKFAAALKTKPWYEVMQESGIRIGRTDPKLDPKGQLTVALLAHAEQVTGQAGLAQQVLGDPENPAQVLPEENLVGRLQSGQLDAGFFYSTETADLKIPAITLPATMALSAHYTASLLNNAPNAAGGAQFLAFLLGPQGQRIMRQHGLDVIKPVVTGDATKVPAAIRSMVTAAK